MLLKNDYNDPADRNDRPEGLKMLDGEEEFVPVFGDATLELEYQIDVEADDAEVNNIMMVVTHRKSGAKGMRAYATVSVTALGMSTEWSARAAGLWNGVTYASRYEPS